MRLWHTSVLANNRSPDSNRGRKRVTRLVVVVVAAFATLWFPIQVLNSIQFAIKLLLLLFRPYNFSVPTGAPIWIHFVHFPDVITSTIEIWNIHLHSNNEFFSSYPSQLILVLKSVGLYQNCTRFAILLQIFSHVLAYTTACINPLLYAFLSENFRKAFKKVSGNGAGGAVTAHSTHHTRQAHKNGFNYSSFNAHIDIFNSF